MEKLLDILKDLHHGIDYTTCTMLMDDRMLDSFDIITLLSEIEYQYGVVITAEKITPENFNSAEAIYRLIQELQNA